MASGKAVIATNNITFPFNIEKEEVGLLVDYQDVKGWEIAVNYLIANPEKAREMGEKGQKLSREVFNYQAFCNEILTHANSLLDQNNNTWE